MSHSDDPVSCNADDTGKVTESVGESDSVPSLPLTHDVKCFTSVVEKTKCNGKQPFFLENVDTDAQVGLTM